MNITAIIEMSEHRQIKIMKKYPCYQTLTELAESRAVRFTYITTTTMEIEGRSIFVFDVLDEFGPSKVDIVSMDEL